MMIDLTSRLVGLRLVWSWWSSFGAIARRYFKLLMSSYDVSALVGFWLPVRIILRRMFRIVWRDCLWVVFSFRSFLGVLFWFTVFGLCLLIDFHVQKFLWILFLLFSHHNGPHTKPHIGDMGGRWQVLVIFETMLILSQGTLWFARQHIDLPFTVFDLDLNCRLFCFMILLDFVFISCFIKYRLCLRHLEYWISYFLCCMVVEKKNFMLFANSIWKVTCYLFLDWGFFDPSFCFSSSHIFMTFSRNAMFWSAVIFVFFSWLFSFSEFISGLGFSCYCIYHFVLEFVNKCCK